MKTNIEMKQTADDNKYIVDTSQCNRAIIVPSPWGYCRMTVRCPYDKGIVQQPCGLYDYLKSLRSFWAKNDNL